MTPTKPDAKKAEWAPHMWQGCDFIAYLRLLARNRCAVWPRYWYVAVIDFLVSLHNTLLHLVQEAAYRRTLRALPEQPPPLFIVGHWRTGTTLLHDLMVCDPRFGYPNTYQCFNPCHFLLTEWFYKRVFRFLMPSKRPMDNMSVGFERPQEDEFAMALLTGDASPYLWLAFPNNGPQYDAYLDLTTLPDRKLKRWKRCLRNFLKRVACAAKKRLVLKSPPHTARLAILAEMFPGAQFLHIVRDPHVVFLSTVHLWKQLGLAHGFQVPNGVGLEEHVLATGLRLYERLEEGKKRLRPEQFHEIRYEDLVRDPAGTLRAAYDHLGLGGFDTFLPRLEAYLATLRGYETNRWKPAPQQESLVEDRWAPIIRRYGYDRPVATDSA